MAIVSPHARASRTVRTTSSVDCGSITRETHVGFSAECVSLTRLVDRFMLAEAYEQCSLKQYEEREVVDNDT